MPSTATMASTLCALRRAAATATASFEDALRAAANRAIDAHVESGDRVGIGHGAMTSMALDRIHERLNDEVRSLSHWSPYDRVGVVNADP